MAFMKRKLLSLLLVLAMCLMLLPVAAFATIDDIAYYGLYINGVEVTSENKDDLTVIPGVSAPGGLVKYTPDDNTLLLKNATISFTMLDVPRSGEATRSYYVPPVIEYEGYGSAILRGSDDVYLNAGTLNIVSEGTNVVNAGESGDVAIKSPAINFDLKAGSSLSVTGGKGPAIVATGSLGMPRAIANMPDAVYIEGPGALKAEIPDNDTMAVAVVAYGNFIIDGASVTLTAGEVEYDGTGYLDGMGESFLPPYSSVALFAQGDVGVIGGSLNATAKGGAMAVAVYGCGAIDIIDSVVTATAGGSDGEMGSGGIVCTGRGEMIIDDEPRAIEPEYGTGIKISGANTVVTAKGGTDALWSSRGIAIEPPLSIKEPKGGYVEGGMIVDPGAPAEPVPTDAPEENYNNAKYVVISAEEVERGYWVKIGETANGSVTSDVPCAGEGTEITLTAKPDQGATLYEIKALDDAGRPVELVEAGDGVYTFVMPASDVRVRARFIKDLPFNDVDPDDYYYDAVEYLYDNKIALGTGEDTFEPDKTCTRAETVTFLWRTLGEPEPTTTTCKFTDVDPDAYYYKAVLWAAENGVTLGTSETTFSPDDFVLRCMTQAFLYRTVQLQGGGFTGTWAFQLDAPDAADVPDWAYESTCWMVMNEIVQGDEAGNLLPLSDCTRGQIAAMIYRTVV
jgi:hypothetical protein